MVHQLKVTQGLPIEEGSWVPSGENLPAFFPFLLSSPCLRSLAQLVWGPARASTSRIVSHNWGFRDELS